MPDCSREQGLAYDIAAHAKLHGLTFPVLKDFDTFDFTAAPALPKQKILELTRSDWVDQHMNCCLIGGSGTGKTHVATALGLALCRQGKRVRFVTAAGLATQLEEAQQPHRLDRLLTQLDRVDLLIIDELGYLSFTARTTSSTRCRGETESGSTPAPAFA